MLQTGLITDRVRTSRNSSTFHHKIWVFVLILPMTASKLDCISASQDQKTLQIKQLDLNEVERRGSKHTRVGRESHHSVRIGHLCTSSVSHNSSVSWSPASNFHDFLLYLVWFLPVKTRSNTFLNGIAGYFDRIMTGFYGWLQTSCSSISCLNVVVVTGLRWWLKQQSEILDCHGSILDLAVNDLTASSGSWNLIVSHELLVYFLYFLNGIWTHRPVIPCLFLGLI